MKRLGLSVFTQLAMLGHEVVHVLELDEAPPLPERFSGGIYVGAAAKNLARLRFHFDNTTQKIYCGKWALRALLERSKVYTEAVGGERAMARLIGEARSVPMDKSPLHEPRARRRVWVGKQLKRDCSRTARATGRRPGSFSPTTASWP